MQGLTSAELQDMQRATLAREVAAYLSAVDTFRAEGCQLEWRDADRPGATLAERLDYYSVKVAP